jgi:hypothetical protein
MIGELEIMIDVLLLLEMSRAKQAGERKKWTIPIVLPSGSTAAARLSHLAKQHRGYIEGKSLVYCAFRLICCQQCLGMLPGGLGETQAVTSTTSFFILNQSETLSTHFAFLILLHACWAQLFCFLAIQAQDHTLNQITLKHWQVYSLLL